MLDLKRPVRVTLCCHSCGTGVTVCCDVPQNALLPENTWCHSALSSPDLLQLHSDSSSSERSGRQPTGSFSPAGTGHRLPPHLPTSVAASCPFTLLSCRPSPAGGLGSRVRQGSAGRLQKNLACCAGAEPSRQSERQAAEKCGFNIFLRSGRDLGHICHCVGEAESNISFSSEVSHRTSNYFLGLTLTTDTRHTKKNVSVVSI